MNRFGKMIVMSIVYIVLIGVIAWEEYAEQFAYQPPQVERTDITKLFLQEELSEQEYHQIFEQTGLGVPAIDALRNDANGHRRISMIQERYFTSPIYECVHINLICKEERVVATKNFYVPTTTFADLQDGDILITASAHTFGWRNGHAAIVVDAENGETLEAMTLGENSGIHTTQRWLGYSNFSVLRLKDASLEIRRKIAEIAKEKYIGLPYSLTADWNKKDPVSETHCSHLIWSIYQKLGFDLDSDGGRIVTPKDIAQSPLLELVQLYGGNPYGIRTP